MIEVPHQISDRGFLHLLSLGIQPIQAPLAGRPVLDEVQHFTLVDCSLLLIHRIAVDQNSSNVGLIHLQQIRFDPVSKLCRQVHRHLRDKYRVLVRLTHIVVRITTFHGAPHDQIHQPVAAAVLQRQSRATRILAVGTRGSLRFRILHTITSPVLLAATLHSNLANSNHRSRSASQSLSSLSRIVMMGWDHPKSLIILLHGKRLLLLLLRVELRHAQFRGLQRIQKVRKKFLTDF